MSTQQYFRQYIFKPGGCQQGVPLVLHSFVYSTLHFHAML